MLYKPSELEEEVGLPARSIREWLDLGLPHERDAQGHIWINGEAFSKWVETIRTRKRGHTLSEDQAYCLKCRRAVPLVAPIRCESGRQVRWTAACPICGAAIHRGIRHG
jgi:hypothetical protein